MEISSSYSVRSVPSTIFLKDGSLKKRVVGVLTEKELNVLVEEVFL
jgi:thioredoxin-like negative regulator of GroEL